VIPIPPEHPKNPHSADFLLSTVPHASLDSPKNSE
jgi:hypothetical protein